MNTDNTCPQCHTPLPADAPAGLCPRCLIRSAAGLAEPAPDVDFPDIGDAADVARRLPQFEIMEMLGRGGMGVVYKARQIALDRIVALKILPPVDALSPDFVERFRREARSLAKLSHPNIVGVHDFGESGGLYFFVMEFVDGVNLREMIRTGKMKAEEALAVVPKICDALQFAHEEGVVHRDIKPENILIDKRGRVKIADFGLAKLLRREANDHTLTMSGMTLGTPRYMAPEQLDKPETVDHRADIYSLGVVFYEMLTGEVPMGRFAPPSEKVRIDVRLDEIVLHALERDAERRYQHASEMGTDVENISGSPAPVARPSAPPVASPVPGEPRLSRCAIFGAIWAALGVIAIVPLVFVLLRFHQPHETLGHMISGEAAPARADAPLGFWILGALSVALTASAVFGTTILGAVSIAQIKRSAGKLYGLRLAFADAVFFPLIVLFVLTAFVLTFGGRFTTLEAPAALVALVVCFFAARAAWRAIAGKTAPAAHVAAPRVVSVTAPAIWLIVVGAIDAIMVVGFWLAWFPESSWTQHPVVCTLVLSGFLLFATMTILIFRGALKMLNREDYAASRLAALCSIFSFNILSIPVGIWALVRLNKPEVKALFSEKKAEPKIAPPSEGGVPRLSRSALIGAIWVTLGPFCAGIIYFLYYTYRMGPGMTLACGTVGLLGISSIIGGTLTSSVAVGQIRRSNGQLTGLPFAAFGVSFYPLLLLGAAAFGLTHLIQIALWTKVHTGYSGDGQGHWSTIAPPPDSYPGMTFMILDSIVALIVCLFFAHAAWRKIAGVEVPATGKNRDEEYQSSEPRLNRRALGAAIWAVVGLLTGIWLLLLYSFYFDTTSTGVHYRPVDWSSMTIFLGLITVSAFFGSMILGAIAIAQIKRSGGKLYGLPVAAFGLLFYPLLAVFAVTVPLAVEIFFVLTGVSLVKLPAPASIIWPALPGIVVTLIVGIAAWRKISGNPTAVATSSATTPVRSSRKALLIVLAIVLAIPLIALGVYFATAGHPPRPAVASPNRAAIPTTSKLELPHAPASAPAQPFMIGTNGPELTNDAVKKLKLSKLQTDEINRVATAYHREYLSLQRRHSKVGKDDAGRILVTIEPFYDESLALAKRLQTELGGIVDPALLPVVKNGEMPTQIFGWGGAFNETVAMWKADGKYNVEEKLTSSPGHERDPYTFNMSGPKLEEIPESFRIFWREE